MLSERHTPICLSTSTRTTLPVSLLPVCLPVPLLAPMSLMSPLMVSRPVDCSCRELIADLSGLTSQPAMGAVCSALEQTGLGTGISHENIQALNTYWSQIRKLYQCFEANVRASDSGVFDHEMPGG